MRSENKKRGPDVKKGEHLLCQPVFLSGQMKATSLLSWCQACLLPPATVGLARPHALLPTCGRGPPPPGKLRPPLPTKERLMEGPVCSPAF